MSANHHNAWSLVLILFRMLWDLIFYVNYLLLGKTSPQSLVVIISRSLRNRNLEIGYVGGLGSGFLLRLQSRYWQKLQSCDGLTGAGGVLPELTQVFTWPQVLSGCWQEASVVCHMDPSTSVLELPYHMVLVSLRTNDPR